MIKPAPIDDTTLLKTTGRFTIPWTRWFDSVYRVLAGKDPLQLASYTVLTLPPATQPGQFIYVSNEAGGAQTAFSDGTNWRRSTDRAIVS